jgi:hypothetical protein
VPRVPPHRVLVRGPRCHAVVLAVVSVRTRVHIHNKEYISDMFDRYECSKSYQRQTKTESTT